MKKVIRLTESDLVRLVKRVVKEQEFDRELSRAPKGILGHMDNWYDEGDRPVNPDEFDYDEELTKPLINKVNEFLIEIKKHL